MKKSTTIQITGLPIEMIVGLYPNERMAPQTIQLDLSLSLGGRDFGEDSILESTVDYAGLVQHIREFCSKRDDGLLEVLGNALCDELMQNSLVSGLHLNIHKPAAADFLGVNDVCVSFQRGESGW